ncbi:MAG TPA: SH3 domain-containing protein [Anaerolineae bacterium]|nr:SH3 domain-containing protein [Anaerolineae bacterium]
MKRMVWVLFLIGTAAALLAFAPRAGATHSDKAALQITVTGTPTGPIVTILDQVNVRLGPSVEYDKIGVLTAGQWAPAVGRSAGGEWIQIIYPGAPDNLAWVYTILVRVEPPSASLPIVEPPPMPTPRITATIDPTLAAQFIDLAPVTTRLPTYTPAAPLIQATLATEDVSQSGGFPPMLAILGLFVVGLFGTTISILRGR